MDDTAKQVVADDLPLPRPAHEGDRALLVESLVRPTLVVEGGVRRQYPQQMALVQDEQVVCWPKSTSERFQAARS
jgi:hypothetical protein